MLIGLAHRTGVALVDPRHKLRRSDDALLGQGLAVRMDQNVPRIDAAPAERIAEPPPFAIAADDREQADLRAERLYVDRRIGRAAGCFIRAIKIDDGHGRLLAEPASMAA